MTEYTCVDVQSFKHNVSLNNDKAAQCLSIRFLGLFFFLPISFGDIRAAGDKQEY